MSNANNPYGIKPMPKKLIEAPGLLGRITAYINSTARMYQPELALGNAIAFTGALVGRKLAAENDGLRTNFYCLGVGESCSGKDHSRKQMMKLASAAGLDCPPVDPAIVTPALEGGRELIGGEDVTSDAAVLYALELQPSLLLQLDEIGHFFSSNKSRNASTHELKIVPLFTKLFTSSNVKYKAKIYAKSANQARIIIDQPNLCIYGTSTRGQIFNAIDSSQIADGFVGRQLMFFSSDIDPEPRTITNSMPPASLVEMVKAWGLFGYPNGTPVPHEPTGNNLLDAMERPLVVLPTAEAAEILDSRRQEFRGHRAALVNKGNPAHPLWGRAYEQTTKLALLASLGDHPPSSCDELRIQPEAAKWAAELITFTTWQTIKQMGTIGDTQYERDQIEVEQAVLHCKGVRISKTDLGKKLKKIKKKYLHEIIAHLVSIEVLKEYIETTGGRPAIYYAHMDNL